MDSPPPSSPCSFYTAPRSPMSITELENPAMKGRSLRKSSYRPALQINEEVRQHCHVFWDEQLYLSAITLLQDLVTPGAAHPECANRPTYAPFPLHIELASILLVHPRYTNQAPPSERSELSSRCITLLRNILAILGPLNANLDEAFSLSPITTSRLLRRSRNRADLEDGSSGSDTEDKFEHPKGLIANHDRMRNCARDFWHIVGWVFNCSVKYPKRWKYWKVWLDYMLKVLDEDWYEREAHDKNDYTASPEKDSEFDEECFSLRRKSLLVRYLTDAKGRSSAVKRVVRSVFADGSVDSIKEFPEVWGNETREVKHQSGQKRKREHSKERGFGDYDDEEETSGFSSSELGDRTPEPLQESDDDTDVPVGDPWLGGPDSISLRQRVLTLLSRVAAYLPDCFADVKDVYEAIFTCVKPLPVPAFSLLISPSNLSSLPTEVFVSLTQLLLLRMLPNNTPEPYTLSEGGGDGLTPVIIERCFLPFAANTHSIADNAKVSILVENIFRLFSKRIHCFNTLSLGAAVEKGISAREKKAKGDKRRRDFDVRRKEDDDDMMWLRASGERLRILRAWVEKKSQEEE